VLPAPHCSLSLNLFSPSSLFPLLFPLLSLFSLSFPPLLPSFSLLST
jgi:hypothetical protein